MSDRIDAAWAALRECLEARSLALHEEVHTYPTPIARCDEQLTLAIEQRDSAFRCLGSAGDLDRLRPALRRAEWLARLRAFAAGLENTDDRVLAARARLLAALERR